MVVEGAQAGATADVAASKAPSDGSLPELPQIRRLRICLLGGDTFVHSVGKTDVASALLRGLTADQPGIADPLFDLAFDHGVFEQAWLKLLTEPPADEPCFDRWGIGPLSVWHSEGRLRFDRPSPGEPSSAYDAEPSQESASLCVGNSDKLTVGHKKSTGSLKVFRELLSKAGHDVDALENLHRDIYSAAQASPRELVRKLRPRPGLLATFARFSPEVGALSGCGATILHVFEPGSAPYGSRKNVAMMYALPPISKVHKGLTPGSFLCALRAAGSNIARTVREYNKLATKSVPEAWERAIWFRADIRARVECLLSDRNLKADRAMCQRIVQASEGWLDLEQLKGAHQDAEMLDALSTSSIVETKVADDGKVFVRRAGDKKPPRDAIFGAKRKLGMDPWSGMEPLHIADPTCWDFVNRGFCPRGELCKYQHPSWHLKAMLSKPLLAEIPLEAAELEAQQQAGRKATAVAGNVPDWMRKAGNALQRGSVLKKRVAAPRVATPRVAAQRVAAQSVSAPRLAAPRTAASRAGAKGRTKPKAKARVIAPPRRTNAVKGPPPKKKKFKNVSSRGFVGKLPDDPNMAQKLLARQRRFQGW